VRYLNLALGQIVISKAGRDAGRKFVIVKLIDELYVMICDGDLRKIEKPKKKKIKHLEITDEIAVPLQEKLEKKMNVSNADIRKVLVNHDNI